jgi:putative ATPase
MPPAHILNAPQDYYSPVERGFERDIQKRLDYLDKLRSSKITSK